jgi:hypothetical protein
MTTEQASSQKSQMEHNYCDYSQEDMSSTKDQTLANGPGGDPSFPVKLHYTLDELTKDGLDDIVSWMPHGR